MSFPAMMSRQEFEVLIMELADPACPFERRREFFAWIVKRVGSNTGIGLVLAALLLNFEDDGIDRAALIPLFAPTLAVICQNDIEAMVAGK